MPRIPDVEPVETIEGNYTVLRHPAFGQIRVSRVSGRRTLYGSDFEHNNYVCVSIYESVLERSLSYDRPTHSPRPLIEIEMSEAQWGSFVSSFGMGMGTPCTLDSVGGERRPGFPLPKRARLHFDEARAAAETVLDDLRGLRAKIEAGTQGLSRFRQAEMLSAVDAAMRSLSDSLPFIVESFAEEMEKTVEKARTEVHAYVTGTVMRAGLAAIESGGPLTLPKPGRRA